MALDIEDNIKDKLLEVINNFKRGSIKLVERNELHITIFFFGNISDSIKDQIIKILDKIYFNRFNVNINGISYFSPGFMRVIFFKVESKEIIDLYNILREQFVNNNIPFDKKETFIPHITIGRVKKKDPELYKIIKRFNDFKLENISIDSVKLKSSVLTEKGPIYNDIYTKSLN